MIGIFDSGAGGLSVYREIVKLLPQQRYIYFSDNAHCPYGEKTREYILDRARAITDELIGDGCEVVVVACNTATAAAIADLRREYSIPFIGMEPAVKPAALSTQTGIVGVLATAGTLKASKYLDTRDRYADGITVVERVGQGFVELVESGELVGALAERVAMRSLAPLLEAGADRIVLGCTHYPFLLPTLQKVASQLAPDREITFIDPAPAAAQQLVRVMSARGISLIDPGFIPVASPEESAHPGFFPVAVPEDSTHPNFFPVAVPEGSTHPNFFPVAVPEGSTHPNIELRASDSPESLQRIFALIS